MTTSTFNIGMFKSQTNNKNVFSKFLKDLGYNVYQFHNSESSMDSILHGKIDVLVYRNSSNGNNGFNTFKRLRQVLLKTGVTFILYLEVFDKEEILVGLELGVDNFICPPFNGESIRFKIENETRKKAELDIFDADNFKNYFKTSLVPMFFILNNKIKKCKLRIFNSTRCKRKRHN